MLCSPRSYSKIKRSFSSITLLVFQCMHRLYTGATLLLQCQESSRSILSAIPPVCTVNEGPPTPGRFAQDCARDRFEKVCGTSSVRESAENTDNKGVNKIE